MAKHILGLDIGKSSVKAVLIEAGLRGDARIVAWEKVDIAGPGGIREAMRRIQEIPILSVPTCQTSVSARAFSFRNLRLPFKDRKKIRQTLPFELEGQIPHPVESVWIDFAVLSQAEGSELFTAAIPKSEVQERSALLAEYGFDAEVIDIDTLPVAARLMQASPDITGLLLDVGSWETAGILFKGETLLQIRSFPFGGDHITAALCEALKIPISEAESRKRKGDTGPAGEKIDEVYQKFFSSLKNTLNSLRLSGLVNVDPEKVWLTGGGSLCGNFAEGLSRALQVPVERVNVTQLAGIKPVGGDDAGWDSMIMNGALALALRPLSRVPGFNFRQGQPRRRGMNFAFDWGVNAKWAAAAAGVVLLLAGSDLLLAHFADRARLERLRGETTDLFQRNFPEVTRVVDPVQQLRAKIAEAKRIVATHQGTATGGTVLSVLRDLSEQVPDTVDFSITALVLDGDKVDIRGEAAGFDAAETIKKELEKTGRYERVAVGSPGMKQADRAEFELNIVPAKRP